MTPFDAYKTYLALKNHFTKDDYDYHKYCGKTRASLQSFYKRKDRYWFEKMSRQKSDQEVIDFFVSNFVSVGDPESLWIGQMIKEGESVYNSWKKKNQSLSYFFKEQIDKLLVDNKFNDLFKIEGSRHPVVFKSFLQGDTSLETLVILNKILNYSKEFDKKLLDPVWEVTSKSIKKYDSFLNIDIFKYRKILKECVL
jgi:hypothetical protein